MKAIGIVLVISAIIAVGMIKCAVAGAYVLDATARKYQTGQHLRDDDVTLERGEKLRSVLPRGKTLSLVGPLRAPLKSLDKRSSDRWFNLPAVSKAPSGIG